MSASRDFDRDIKALEMRLTQTTFAEINKLRTGLFQLIAARSNVLKAMLEELNEADIARIEARAIQMSGSPEVAAKIEEWFNPEPDKP